MIFAEKEYVNLKKYFIAPVGKVTKDSIKNLIQTSMNTLRKNIDGTKVLLKHSKDSIKPAVFDSSSTMTHAEMLKEMDKPEWGDPRFSGRVSP